MEGTRAERDGAEPGLGPRGAMPSSLRAPTLRQAAGEGWSARGEEPKIKIDDWLTRKKGQQLVVSDRFNFKTFISRRFNPMANMFQDLKPPTNDAM